MEHKITKKQMIHIAIIVLGAIFMLVGAFHDNIWFDEAYSVGLMNQTVGNLVHVAIHDVHPLFYYLFLKVFTLITGNSIIAMRIFSILGMIVLAILGYTHIRKDFGEKTGIFFSFFINFLPVTLLYSNEIRMYSWAAVFVLLTAVYAYRITKENKAIHWILFCLFSILSAYTHYFAMMAIGLINIVLFIYMLKNRKIFLNKWLAAAVSQIILFIPGLIVFLLQALRVASGFWIKVRYPDVFFEILKFNFLGEVTDERLTVFILVAATLFYVYLIVKAVIEFKKDKKQSMIPILFGSVYLLVIIISLILSNVSDIFTTRYTVPMLGLITVFISYFLAKSNKKIITIVVICMLILSINNSIIFFNKNYAKENQVLKTTINEEIQEEDIFVYTAIDLGAVLAEYYPNNQQYFYNAEHWSVEEAYKAFAPQMKTIESLDEIQNHTGRIWIIDNTSNKMFDIISEKMNINKIKEKQEIITPYKNTTWVISLVEKVGDRN